MIKVRVYTIVTVLLIILSFVIAEYAYQHIEGDTVASHWNDSGEVDGYMSKFWGLFLLPIILVGVYFLFVIIPKIDPLRSNIEKFRKYYDMFILGFIIYMLYIFILTIMANMGFEFNMTKMILPAIGVLFLAIGFFLPKVKRNWFIGIRTPWTISNDKVWEKTHTFGATLFKTFGIIVIFGLFFPNILMWFILVPIIIIVLWLYLFSYREFVKLKKK